MRTPPRPDLLGRFVPTAIARVPPSARLERPIKLAFMGLLSAGFLPYLQLRNRLRNVISLERQQLDLASELLAAHLPEQEIPPLTESVARVHASKPIGWLADLCFTGALGSAVVWLAQHGWTSAALRTWYFTPPQSDDRLGVAALVLLVLAYVLQHVQTNRHVSTLQQYALAYNAVLDGRAAKVSSPALVWGIRPLYLIVGAVMMYFGLLWSLPMMLSWAAFRSFITRSDRLFRADLSTSLQAVSGVAPVVESAELCHNPQCRQPLPEDARFCPRCGRVVTLEHV